MEESWRRKWKVVRKWNAIVWKGILFSFFCLLALLDSASDPLGLCLTKKLSSVICFCLRFDGLRVRNSRHSTSFVTLCVRKIGSWTELFVIRGVREPRFDCTCIYSVLYRLYFLELFRLCIFIVICFVCTSVRTAATEWQLNCSK